MKTILCLLLLCLSASLSARAQRYVEIRGEMELTFHSGPGAFTANGRTNTSTFVCTFGTNEWRMESSWESFDKLYCDGTNIYESLRSTNLPVTKNLTINIHPTQTGHPFGDTYANIPWLAFCSGNYLKEPGRLIPLPMGHGLNHTRDRFAYTDKTEVFNDEPGLPIKVELFTSKKLFFASENEFDRQYFFGDRYTAWTKRTAAHLQDGELMFHYAVTESTNFQGWRLPTKFEFFQNARPYEQNGDWQARGTVRVTSICAASKPNGLFDPTWPQTVVDWRFRDEVNQVEGLIYSTTNDYALPITNPGLQIKFGMHVRSMLTHRKPTPAKETSAK